MVRLAGAGRAGMRFAAGVTSAIVVAGLALYHGINFLMIVLAAGELRRERWLGRRRRAALALESGALPGVSVIVPAYNEEVSIVRTVRSILRARYPDLEVIVVSDGSADQTLSVLADAFALRSSSRRGDAMLPTQQVRAVFESATDPRLLVVDKRNGGKADALNAGINLAAKPLLMAVDADIVLDTFAIVHLAQAFAIDPTVVAASGMIRPHNGCAVERARVTRARVPARPLEAFQVLEYIRAYGVGRLFFNRFNAHLIVSGAFGLFSRQLLIEISGYQPHAVGEDMELVVRLHRHCVDSGRRYRVWFAADALCWTEAPHDIGDLGRQRTRWHQGLLGVLRVHRRMAFAPRYGAVGMLAFPFFLFELAAPALEALGWVVVPGFWASGLLTGDRLTLWVAVSILLSTSVSLAAVFLDAVGFGPFTQPIDTAKLVLCALVEHAGYRQLTVFYRLRAFYRYFRTLQLKSGWRSPARMVAR